jgi:hypothetical protein
MEGLSKWYGIKKGTVRRDDVEAPVLPILDDVPILVPQLTNGGESLTPGTLKICDLNPLIVQDFFVTVHKVKVATHAIRLGWRGFRCSGCRLRQLSAQKQSYDGSSDRCHEQSKIRGSRLDCLEGQHPLDQGSAHCSGLIYVSPYMARMIPPSTPRQS